MANKVGIPVSVMASFIQSIRNSQPQLTETEIVQSSSAILLYIAQRISNGEHLATVKRNPDGTVRLSAYDFIKGTEIRFAISNESLQLVGDPTRISSGQEADFRHDINNIIGMLKGKKYLNQENSSLSKSEKFRTEKALSRLEDLAKSLQAHQVNERNYLRNLVSQAVTEELPLSALQSEIKNFQSALTGNSSTDAPPPEGTKKKSTKGNKDMVGRRSKPD